MSTDRWIPLFPLHTVLFPLGLLPLRVFEPRYTDMVRNCMKDNMPFGVVLIRSGNEVGAAAETEDIGCLAHIRHWDMQDSGILLLMTQGGERFRILESRETPDHRLEARIEMLPEALPAAVSILHADTVDTLQEVIDEVREQGEAEQGDAFLYPFPLPSRLDDAGWVADRWSEILPLELAEKQKLLGIDDPLLRLQRVEQLLMRLGVIKDPNLPLSGTARAHQVLH